MNLGLAGKRAIVTGSARGIGFATARLLLEEGARVLLNDVDAAKLQEAASSLAGAGESVAHVAADISTADGVQQLFAAADEQLGGVDILINNAGVYLLSKNLANVTEQEWDKLFRINVKSVQLCSAEAVRRMAQSAGGVILNASSYAAILPSVGGGVYAATKAAVLNYTRTLAAECAPLGIRVNAYVPGVIATDMTAANIAQHEDKLLDQLALRRFGSPDEVAAPLVFLASEKAAYITGAILEITGGKLVAQNPYAAWS